MSSRFSIGLDFGTESGRVMLVDLDGGAEMAWTVVPYRSGVIDGQLPDGTTLGRDWALQDPMDYLAVLRDGIPKVLRDSGVPPSEIVGIGVDFTACTVLPVLRGGTPLCTLPLLSGNPHAWVKLWKHHAAQPQADAINQAAAGSGLLRAFGGKVSSEWLFPKLLQILQEAPEVYAACDRFLEAGDWLVWQLTGEEGRSECAAGYKSMWIKGAGFPSRDFLRAVDPRLENAVEEKLSSKLLPLGAKAGGLTAAMAAATGLLPGTPVAAANVDAHAGVPACGVVEPARLVMIMGTSLCHMLLARERRFVEGVAGVIEDGIVPGLWGYEAGQAAVGDIYGWFFRTVERSPESLAEGAMRLKPGESGLIALDWWNGNRSVLTDAGLTGVLIGATLATRPDEIYRALVEATAFGTRTVIEAFEKEGVPIHELVACGGLAQKSPLVMQIFADVTNREIRLPRTLQGSGLGAAMHGAVAAGAYRDIAEAAAHMASLQELSYRPDAAAHAVYRKLYAEYAQLHDYFGRGGNDVMKRLKTLQASVRGIN